MVKLTIVIKDLKGGEVKLMVNSSETLAFGKKLYSNLLNLSDSFQWNFNGEVLNDNKTFEYYGIEDFDIILSNTPKNKKIRIYITNIRGKPIPLEVDPSETIAYGKKLYGNLTNEFDRVWKFEGSLLNNNKTFEFYEIEDGDYIISNRMMLGGCLNKNEFKKIKIF